jgi:virginiamycin B lyase
MIRFTALATLPLLWLAGGGKAPDATRDAVEIQEWTVPWENSRPRDPYVGPDGAVWFVGQTGHYVARLDPRSGAFKKYDLDPGTGPHNLIVDGAGQIWYAGNLTGHIGKLDPATGKITKYPMPDPAARDPHTLIFDRAGDLWFTVQGGNFVGKLETKSGKVHLITVPTERARPYGIVLDREGRPWVNLFGSDKLATIDPATMKLREVKLPRAEARSRRIALTSDGAIWYVDYARGQLGRHDPASGAFREWVTPGGAGSRPYAMAVDDQDRVWFVETGAEPNHLVGFDPRTGEFFSNTPIKSGGGTVRHMVFHKPTGELWFGTDTNTIGRARIPRV